MESSCTPMEQDACRSCGICGKPIVDQGVLDCCQHLFCFSCIDDWASVTNLCPICKLRFRLITCLPGRDAAPGSEQDIDRPRDDDQRCPSFYIDEEAVTCLEGDECLVRSGKVIEVEADDTSVACDSCDRWYHAGCVGFDTLACTQESWWCPRCSLGTQANLGWRSASQKSSKSESAANNSSNPVLEMHLSVSTAEAGTSTGTAACNQQRNSQETASQGASIKLHGNNLQHTLAKLPEPSTVADKATCKQANGKKRSRAAMEASDHKESVEAQPQGLIAGLSAKESQDLTLTNTTFQQLNMELRQASGHADAEDLITIVSDPSYRVAQVDEGDGCKSPKLAGESAIRTRIIMHRAESGESSVVEQVRQQMRSAAGYGAAQDLGRVDLSDERFLAAYKAAVAAKDKGNTQSTTVKKGSSWVLKALTCGTSVRDKLTKKLYGGTKTRRTWDRDWDVAFWKGGRGIMKKQTEKKVEGPTEQSDADAQKIYLADASLFARTDESEPISASQSNRQLAPDLGHNGPSDKVLREAPAFSSRGNGQLQSHQCTRPASKCKSSKEPAGASSVTTQPAKLDVNDKRKWALEVLARKKGELSLADSSTVRNAGKNKSLVDCLPMDLRPSIDITVSSKIPCAVRQAQLNRILEKHLKSSGVRRNPRSVKCQQAIAAAVAKEHEIFEKSNSKGVYMNLCARATSVSVCQDKGKGTVGQLTTTTDSKVREALEATGLLSDSDSDSPCGDVAGSSLLPRESKEDSACADSTLNTAAAQVDASVGQDLQENSPVTAGLHRLSGSPVTAGLHLCLSGEQQPSLGAEMFCSSPLYLDEDYGLDGEDLETPMLLGHTASSGQKDAPSKVKVVLTTLNRFKHAGSTGAESQNENPDKAVEDTAVAVETSEPMCKDTSGVPTGEETGDAQSHCITTDSNRPEVVESPSESTKQHAPDPEESSKDSNLMDLRATSTVIEGKALVPTSPRLGDQPVLRTEDCGNCTLEDKAAKQECTGEEKDRTGKVDVDDWMKVGKFPSLESRIEEVRSRVLKKSVGVLNKLLTKYPSSGPNDEDTNCVSMDCMDTECTGTKKEDRERGVDEGGSTDQIEVKEANASVQKQVHAYVREHLRPLYKSGVITAKEYQWATAKTASKVMQYHPEAKSAAFLIAEGSKVKKLAEDYLQSCAKRKN